MLMTAMMVALAIGMHRASQRIPQSGTKRSSAVDASGVLRRCTNESTVFSAR